MEENNDQGWWGDSDETDGCLQTVVDAAVSVWVRDPDCVQYVAYKKGDVNVHVLIQHIFLSGFLS